VLLFPTGVTLRSLRHALGTGAGRLATFVDMDSERSCDVAVLGSGAAGLVAAIAAADDGAEVAVFEKSDLLGGTSAISGGIIWMPNNHLQAPAGIEDSRGEALAYLDSLALGQIDSDMAATFVDTGPEALAYLAERTPCSFHLLAEYPDYHPEHPGGRPGGGRSIDNGLFAFGELGEWADRVRCNRINPVMLSETPLGGATELPPTDLIAERVAARKNGMGLGLVGALLRACLDRGVRIRLGAAANHLTVDKGRVTGVELKVSDGIAHVAARRGVVLATGGFEWNAELCRTFLRGPMTAPAGSPDNTGDGLVMAMNVGARLGNMRNAWWVPVTRADGNEQWGSPRPHLVLLERTRPGSIMVNRTGRRFCNEAGNYNAMGGVFHQFDPAAFDYPNLPAWLVFDHRHKLAYDVGSCSAGPDVADWITTAATLSELADRLGLDGDTLQATVDRFNEHAVLGTDPDFGRGVSAYDTFNGDRTKPGAAATLGPLDRPPYYAIPIESGSLGTNGGPKTDTRCRVLSSAGGVIPGLYAAGNVMAAPTGMVYGGAGGTLGPALTFGFIAGREAASESS
jgi:3-oxosteroid 1-dehydrogenase